MIDDFRVTWHLFFDYIRRARDDDHAIAHQHSAAWYDCQIAKLGTDPRPFRTGERDELRSVQDGE